MANLWKTTVIQIEWSTFKSTCYWKRTVDLVPALKFKKKHLLLLYLKDFSFWFIWTQVQSFVQPFVILIARTEEFVYLLSGVSFLQGPVGNIVRNLSWPNKQKILTPKLNFFVNLLFIPIYGMQNLYIC